MYHGNIPGYFNYKISPASVKVHCSATKVHTYYQSVTPLFDMTKLICRQPPQHEQEQRNLLLTGCTAK